MTNVDKYRMKYLFFRLKILFLCINLLIMWKSSNFIYIFRCFQTINNILQIKIIPENRVEVENGK